MAWAGASLAVLAGNRFATLGLTLMELIVSVGMAAILVALAIPAISSYHKKAQRVECENSVKDFLKVQQLYYLDNNTFYPLPGKNEVTIAWDQSKGNPPARPEEYFFPKLAMEFPIDSHRRYRIKAESRDGEEFMRRYVFELKTDEDFDNNDKMDYYSYKKSIWQQGAKGTFGDADIVNNFWFEIGSVPAWSEYNPSELH
jgi:type II secretory pathway pseudopilin PulG